MTTLVMVDGMPHAPEDAKVSVFDRGFLYGDSVFETIRTYGGRPYALDAHLERLRQSAERVFIELPVSLEQLAAEVARGLELAGNPESYVRVIVTRGSGPIGLDTGFEARPLRVVIITELVPPPREAYERGISVISFRTQRVAEATDAVGAKVGNYLVAVLAMRRARAAGASEALIVDAAGHVVEGATSNVFIVSGTRLITPPLEAGILAGITRARVIEVAAELGIATELLPVTLEDLGAASEVFITSSIREILPVVELDGRPIGSGHPGPLTARLHAAFRKKLRESGA
jgi:branched-chain amino acid aminotransferase